VELPTVTDTLDRLEALIKDTDAPLHQRMLEVFRDHWWGEVIGDLDTTMATMPEDPQYRVYGTMGEAAFGGAAVARAMYRDLLDAGLMPGAPLVNDRWTFGSWGLHFEADILGLARGAGIPDAPEPLEPDQLYISMRRGSIIIPFDTDAMLMEGEILYMSRPTILGPGDASTRRQLLGTAVSQARYEP
jgi:hypothetical protein